MEAAGSTGSDRCCKVGRVAARYGLDGLDGALVDRHDDGDSLRSLAAFVNEEVFVAAIEDVDLRTVEDADALFDLFTDDSADAGRLTALRDRLERSGVDVAGLERSFVSHQTVKSHLNDCLGVDTAREGSITVEDAYGVIDWNRSRTAAVAEEKVDRLRDADVVDVGPVDVSVVVRVTCESCGRTHHLDDVLRDSACDCGAEVDGGDRR